MTWALAVVVLVCWSADGAEGQAGPGIRPTYAPPVDAPVADPFRAPDQPWAPGNRGIEYATTPGAPVHAIGPGVVTFAGPVAGALHVTVRHPDGLRSSYSYLAVVRVGAGDAVDGGAEVGLAGARFHLGVRRDDDTYLDPASLWGRPVGGGRAHLVPDDAPPGSRGPPAAAARGIDPSAFGQVGDLFMAAVRPW